MRCQGERLPLPGPTWAALFVWRETCSSCGCWDVVGSLARQQCNISEWASKLRSTLGTWQGLGACTARTVVQQWEILRAEGHMDGSSCVYSQQGHELWLQGAELRHRVQNRSAQRLDLASGESGKFQDLFSFYSDLERIIQTFPANF